MRRIEFETGSADATRAAGEKLAGILRTGDVVALCGELGAGKTVFTQGLARGLKTDPAILVTSPTFVILHEYPGEVPLYHFDFYRLGRAAEADGLGFEEYLEGDGVCAIEWAEKFPELLGPAVFWVKITGLAEERRRIEVRAGESLPDDRWRPAAEKLRG